MLPTAMLGSPDSAENCRAEGKDGRGQSGGSYRKYIMSVCA